MGIVAVGGIFILVIVHFCVYAFARAVWRITESPEFPLTEPQRQRGAVIAACLIVFSLRAYATMLLVSPNGLWIMAGFLLTLVYPECILPSGKMFDPLTVIVVLAADTACMGILMYKTVRA